MSGFGRAETHLKNFLVVFVHGRSFSGSAFFLGWHHFLVYVAFERFGGVFLIYHLHLFLSFFLHFYFYCMEHDGMKKQKITLQTGKHGYHDRALLKKKEVGCAFLSL